MVRFCWIAVSAKPAKASPFNLLPFFRLLSLARRKYEVVVRGENKFELDGVYYTSLSAVARAITGTRWNGKLFFGVK